MCPSCGKPNILIVESCSFCAERLSDKNILSVERDPMYETCITGKGLGAVLKWHFDAVVCENPYPIGKRHLLAIPKGTFSHIYKLKRKSLKIMEFLKQIGLEALDEADRRNAILGFSYPAEYNQLHLHIVVPPVTNFLLFRASHWYSYNRVVEEIAQKGMLQKQEVAKDPLEVDPWVLKKDWSVRNATK